MISPLHISLIAFLIVLSGTALYLFRKAPRSPAHKSSNTETKSLAASNDEFEFKLTTQFFELLSNKPSNAESNNLAHYFNLPWQDRLNDPSLFIRQPLILPRLLQAMKADTNSQKLVEIVLEDPGLTAEVLKLANSPIYRNTQNDIQNIDYALVMLGNEGLHSLICSSLMKPTFSNRRADGFSSALFWDWALVSSQLAQQ